MTNNNNRQQPGFLQRLLHLNRYQIGMRLVVIAAIIFFAALSIGMELAF